MNTIQKAMVLLVAIGVVGSTAVSVGMVINQDDYWLVADTYSILAFATVAAIGAILIRRTARITNAG